MRSVTLRLPAGNGAAVALGRIRRYLEGLPSNVAFDVTVAEHKPRRSLAQNALLWSLYADILERGGPDMHGWDKDDLHRFFCIEHFGSEVKTVFNRQRHVPLRTTSGLNRQEMTDFIDHVVRFMAERGVALELPGEKS